MTAQYDFPPIEQMRTHLQRADAQRDERGRDALTLSYLDACMQAAWNELWFLNGPARLTRDPSGEIEATADSVLSIHLHGYVGRVRVDVHTPPVCTYTPEAWLDKPNWPLVLAPYIAANFFDGRVKNLERYRQKPIAVVRVSSDDRVIEMSQEARDRQMRYVMDCTAPACEGIFFAFRELISALRGDIEVGIKLGRIVELDLDGVPHVKPASTIAYMRSINACALPVDSVSGEGLTEAQAAQPVAKVVPVGLSSDSSTWMVHARRFATDVRVEKKSRYLTKGEIAKKVHALMAAEWKKGDATMAKRGGKAVPEEQTIIKVI